MRLKIWWMMPWEVQPRWGQYFRIGPYVGKCVFKSPWLVVQLVDRR